MLFRSAFGSAIWTYFIYLSAVKEKTDEFSYTISYSSAALFTGLVITEILRPITFSEVVGLTSFGYIYPLLGASALAIGVALSFKAFQKTTTKTRIQDAIIAVMANGEVIPLMLISYLILGEWSIEGFVGSIIVLAGLSLIYYSETIKYSEPR